MPLRDCICSRKDRIITNHKTTMLTTRNDVFENGQLYAVELCKLSTFKWCACISVGNI
jgi:hypothetical protein